MFNTEKIAEEKSELNTERVLNFKKPKLKVLNAQFDKTIREIENT